jgi:hypothetical protein
VYTHLVQSESAAQVEVSLDVVPPAAEAPPAAWDDAPPRLAVPAPPACVAVSPDDASSRPPQLAKASALAAIHESRCMTLSTVSGATALSV